MTSKCRLFSPRWPSSRSTGFISRADAYIERIVDYCLGFSTFPNRGTCRDDLLPGLRTIGFERRVTIAFFVAGNAVIIEGIFYAGQNVDTSFGNDGEG